MKNKIFVVRAASAVAIMLIGLPVMASATSPAIGTADTSITLLGLSYKSSGAGVTHTINVAVSSGIATTDPIRNNLQALKASTSFLGAQVAGVADQVDQRHGDWAVNVESSSTDSEKKATSTAEEDEPIETALMSGEVTATAMSAEVDPKVPSAKASAVGLNLDLTIGEGGLIDIDDVRGSISDESNPTQAKADQSISIGRLGIVPLKELLDRVGGLSPEALLALAGKWGNEQTKEQVATATAVADQLGSLLGVPPSTSLSTVLSTATGTCTLTPALPLCATLAELQGELDELLDMFSATGVVDITGLVAGVTAEAFDDRATAKALASYEAIHVLGRTINQTATIDDALKDLDATLQEMKSDFESSVTALAGLKVGVQTIFTEEKTAKDGDYQTASAAVAVLRFVLQLPSVGSSGSGGFSAQASLGDPLSIDARVLTLAGSAEHRPSILDAPGGGGGGPTPANTGPEETWIVSGLVLMAVGLRVRRWLGDAA